MRYLLPAVFTLSALVAATPVAQAQASASASSDVNAPVGDLRLSCRGAALLCCNPLLPEDADDDLPGTGIFRSCNGIHSPFIATPFDLEVACNRVAACCLTKVAHGPPEPALECTSFSAVLAEDGKRLEDDENDLVNEETN